MYAMTPYDRVRRDVARFFEIAEDVFQRELRECEIARLNEGAARLRSISPTLHDQVFPPVGALDSDDGVLELTAVAA